MTENQNIQTIQSLYDAFKRGDIPFIIDRVTPDVLWRSYCEGGVPWSGDFSTKAGVPRFFSAIAEHAEITSFEPGEFVAQGDTVVSMGTSTSQAKSTGKAADSKWVFVWKLRDGLVYSYEQFHEPTLARIFVA